MKLTREQTVEGLESEWATFEELLRGLSETDLKQPTRCASWTVRDIAAHVVGGLADIAGGTVGASSGQQQADDRAGRSAAQLADEFHDASEISMKLLRSIDDYLWAQPSPAPGFTFRQGIEVLWLESFLHEDDIRDALGMPHRYDPGLALQISLHHVAEEMGRHGWTRTTLDLDGIPKIRIGPGGPPITGDPMRFLLAATGRIPAGEIGLDETVNIYRT